MKVETKKKIQIGGMILFICYLAALIYFLFFAELWGRAPGAREFSYNLVPFKEIKRFWHHREMLGCMAVFLNLAGNVIGFIPFGMILPVIWQKSGKLCRIVLLSFSFSLMVETTQLVFRVGSFDVDDLMLNTLGGVIGFFVFYVCNRVRRKLYG